MEEEKEIGIKFIATIRGMKGSCHAHHKAGQKFELNCYDSGGLCGFFYHDIFPYLNAMQFGGKYPWWIRIDEVECPDRYNTVSLKSKEKIKEFSHSKFLQRGNPFSPRCKNVRRI
jgi:uncharacterized repeat protein (TIGR04076 family)